MTITFSTLAFFLVCAAFAGFMGGYALGETCTGNNMKELYEKRIRQMERRIMKKLGEIENVD